MGCGEGIIGRVWGNYGVWGGDYGVGGIMGWVWGGVVGGMGRRGVFWGVGRILWDLFGKYYGVEGSIMGCDGGTYPGVTAQSCAGLGVSASSPRPLPSCPSSPPRCPRC